MARNTKYKMQAIDQPLLNLSAIPGITTPQINYGVSIGGKDRPANGATAGADWLSNLTGIPADLFYKLTDTLDSVQDGAIYGKILATDITEGHILLSSAEGSLDNIADGATYGRILLTGISAGKIVLAQVDGDLDDIADGSNFGKVSSTNISAGNIVLQVDQNLSQQGIKIMTASTGARVELLPDANTGISILDDEGNPVFQALVGGTNIGDVIIGDYASGQGLLYDKSAGTIKYKNIEWSEVIDDNGNKPADNADVTGDNTAANVTTVNGTPAFLVEGRANAIFTDIFFIGSKNDGLTENPALGLTRYVAITNLYGANNEYSSLASSTLGLDTNPYIIDYDNDMEFTVVAMVENSSKALACFGISEFGINQTGDSEFRHALFKITGTSLYASIGDGTTEELSSAITGITLSSWNKYRIKFIAGDSVEFYVNDVLKATLSTNIPTGNTDLPQIFIGVRNNSQDGTGVSMRVCNNYTIKISL